MAYLYRKIRSPFWYIQYLDSERKKHDKSTGLRADDPNDTAKAKRLRAELEANEHGHIPLVNGAACMSVLRASRYCSFLRSTLTLLAPPRFLPL